MSNQTFTEESVKRTVLVLDDDQPLRNAVTRILTQRGYLVLPAASGQEARRVSTEWAGVIDLLLCDLVLPDAAGREVANVLQAHRPGLRVLFTSGYSSLGSFRKDLERNSWVFLSKPFEVPDLLAAVALAIGEPPSLQGTSAMGGR